MKNYNDWYFLNADTRVVLSRGQLAEGQTPEQRYAELAYHAQKILKIDGYAERMIDYFKRGWASISTPVFNNFGRNTGLPISCFGSYIGDSITSIFDKNSEIAHMTQRGGGTSFYLGALRPRGAKIEGGGVSEGPNRFAEIFDKTVEIVNQGGVRRGACAAYLPADYENHQDVLDFLEHREDMSPVQTLFLGLTFTDKWLDELRDDIDNKRTTEKTKIWRRMLKKRDSRGHPYLMFKDNANNQKPQVYKDKDLEIVASNLCNEIMLPSSEEESFVCCLSSVNLLHYDAWKETRFVQDMHLFLDAVMQEFIDKSEGVRDLRAANRFAKRHRALGLGVLGYHSLLKEKQIPVESHQARNLNNEIFLYLKRECLKANEWAGKKYGSPEILEGTGLRNTTSMAIAPTLSSSFILGQVSAGCELDDSVYYSKNNQKGEFAWRCPTFTKTLEKYGQNKEEIWDSIASNSGSVQHLNFLSDEEKMVYKTFSEIDQTEVIVQAADRQRFIDQGQSLNLKYTTGTKIKIKSDHLLLAHKLGLKGIYYQINENAVHKQLQKEQECESCSA